MKMSPPSDSSSKKTVNRREFLYYIWTASAALLLAGTGGGIAWYLSGRDKPRRETLLSIDLKEILKAGNGPVQQDPRVLLCNTPSGFYAFHNYCTHLGCSVKWVPSNFRFECPCHAAKFEFDGTKIKNEGPARRNLDSFLVNVKTPNGTISTPKGGGPVDISNAIAIEVDLEVYFVGKPVS